MTKTKLIVNLTRGEALCVGELADKPLRRMRGLMGRRGLPAGEGLLLSPAPAIHTAFMRFPIDALFLDRDLRVVHIVEQLEPWRMASNSRAHAVLELCAGESARRKVAVGDRLELRERKPVPEVSALAPLRVLVVSLDHHFRTVIALLLERRTCSVTTTANGARLAELVGREDIDAVVIDVSGAPVDTTVEHIDEIKALERHVGTVLVDEHARKPLHGQPVLAKWGPFGDLAAAIESSADEGLGRPR